MADSAHGKMEDFGNEVVGEEEVLGREDGRECHSYMDEIISFRRTN